MDQPDYDDDELINDYLEENDEPPVEYDEEFLEEMALEQDRVPHCAKGPSQSPNHIRESPRRDELMSDDEDLVPVGPPREVILLNNDAQSDPYSFERYSGNSAWRKDQRRSNQNGTMHARQWKVRSVHPDDDAVMQLPPSASKRQKPSAPDSQLLDYLSRRSRRCRKLTLRSDMSRHPVVGASCLPMTLFGGQRVYVKQCNPKNLNGTSPPRLDCNPLGMSITDLLERVNLTRRQHEHQRVVEQSRVDTNVATVSEHQNHAPLDSRLWVDKHAPSSFAHLLSDARTNREVLRALREWDLYVFHKDPPPRPEFQQRLDKEAANKPRREKNARDHRPEESSRVILLYGPPGVGKTTLAHIIARHAGYRPLEVNGSDERSTSVLHERVVRAMESTTLNIAQMQGDDDGVPKPNCLILDEIDGADAKSAVQSIVDIIRADIPDKGARKKAIYLRRPIIFICNNKFAPALKPLLPYAKHFSVESPSPSRLVARLQSVLASEGLVVHGGSSLLHELVMLSSGDIRSCLYTLQFASSRAQQYDGGRDASKLDITAALMQSLNGDGLKDSRKDLPGLLAQIFKMEKEKGFGAKTVRIAGGTSSKVLDSVLSYGDSSKVLESLFLNILRVSYIDPAFDRCAAAHEWLSASAAIPHSVEELHMPSAAAAVHLFCRVEQRPDLTYSSKEIVDVRYQRETNLALLQKFSEGLSPQLQGMTSVNSLAPETIPYALWSLSSGHGNSALGRAVTSVGLLNNRERGAFETHVAVLRSLGLTYKVAVEPLSTFTKSITSPLLTLDPPIDQLIRFVDLNLTAKHLRSTIPSAMKLLLAQRAEFDGMLESRGTSGVNLTASTENDRYKKTNQEVETKTRKRAHSFGTLKDGINSHGQRESENNIMGDKRAKSEPKNFLAAQARKAKAAKSARTAARVGVIRRSHQDQKFSHTGSGLPLSQVIRLKYVKGFTQAVRTRCCLDDLN